MLEFIRELISKRWIKARVKGSISQSKQTDLVIPQERVLNITLFLVTLNGILGKFGNGVVGSLFADDLEIYKKSESSIQSTVSSDQQVG